MKLAVIILGAIVGGFAGLGINWAFWTLLAEATPGPEALGWLWYAIKCSPASIVAGVVFTAAVLYWKLP